MGSWRSTSWRERSVLFHTDAAQSVGKIPTKAADLGVDLLSVASTLGATCAFLLGRSLARDWVATRIEGNASFMALDRAIAAEGWKIVLLTRLSPLFPFSLLNYALSLMRVSLRHYVLASWMGMLPGTVMYVYLGSLARAGVEDRSRTAAEGTLYAVGLVATIAVAVVVTRLAHRALANRTTTAS